MIHVSRSGATLGIFEEEKVREGLETGEFIGTDLGWMEGMPAWRPLTELEDFHTVASVPPPEPEPTAEAAAIPAELVSPVMEATAERPGLPWENREQLGFFNALLDTVMMVLLRPADAFSAMRREGGLLDPLLYALILGMLGAVVSMLFSIGFQALDWGNQSGMGMMMGMGMMSAFTLLLAPFAILIFAFIFAGLVHLALMLLGGANRPFETTLRVTCYSSGSANVLQLIPLCGGLIAGIYALVLDCMGLARAHETDTWRAVVAVLSPLLLCCGSILLVVMLMGGLITAANWR